MLQQKGKKNCAGEAIPNRTQINVEVANVVFVSVLHKIHWIIIPVSCEAWLCWGGWQSAVWPFVISRCLFQVSSGLGIQHCGHCTGDIYSEASFFLFLNICYEGDLQRNLVLDILQCIASIGVLVVSTSIQHTALPWHNINVRGCPWWWHATKIIIYQ